MDRLVLQLKVVTILLGLCIIAARTSFTTNMTDSTEPSPLHWSFNQSHSRLHPNFGNEFVSILSNSERRVVPGSTCRTTYAILPNFVWNKPQPDKNTVIGSIEITRKIDKLNGSINYVVLSENIVSGENSTYSFNTNSDFWHTLKGNWTIEINCQSRNGYNRYLASGAITEQTSDCTTLLHLTINGSKIELGKLEKNPRLTTPWALLDIFRTIDKSYDIFLLEDLERLRTCVRINPIESWQWPDPYSDMGIYSGWCVHGTGLSPTYYWKDCSNTITIVSSLYQTWVLTREIKGVDS